MVETQTRDLVADGGATLPEEPADGIRRAAHPASQFRGRGDYAIDDKGRLTLPQQMRKQLLDGGNIVVLDGRAVIWDEATYRDAVDELHRLVETGDLVSANVRNFTANTHPVTPDAQGRIVIPHAVRVEAELDLDVVILGAGSRIEIVPAGVDALDLLVPVPDEVVDALDRGRF